MRPNTQTTVRESKQKTRRSGSVLPNGYRARGPHTLPWERWLVSKRSKDRGLVAESILTATMELLSTSDPAQVSMRQIARRAGVGVGSLYDHFESRDGLLDAVLDHVTRSNFEHFAAHLSDLGDLPLEAVAERLYDTVVEVYLGPAELTRTGLSTIVRLDRLPWVQAERDRFAGMVASLLRVRIPEADPEELEVVVVTMMDMVMGVTISELYRSADPSRRGRIRETVLRALHNEIAVLRGS